MNSIYFIYVQNSLLQWRCIILSSSRVFPSHLRISFTIMLWKGILASLALVIAPLMWIIRFITASPIAKSIRMHLWRLFHFISFALQFPLLVVPLLSLLVHFHLQCICPIQVVTMPQASVAAIHPVTRLEHLHSVS